MVTSATYQHALIFNTPEKLDLLQNKLFDLAQQFNWQLEAWAVFANHYHFLAYSKHPETLKEMIKRLHGSTSHIVNKIDNKNGRQVWHQYWDTKITIETSHYARLNYISQNPVRHRLADLAVNYHWCSASWMEKNHPRSYIKTIQSFPIDNLNIKDDF